MPQLNDGPPDHPMHARRRTLLALFLLPSAPFTGPAHAGTADTRAILGDWTEPRTVGLEALRIEADHVVFLDRRGNPSGPTLPYRFDGRVVKIDVNAGGRVQRFDLALQPDGRLTGQLPDIGPMVFTRRPGPAQRPSAAATAGTAPTHAALPLARDPVPPVLGLYVQENQPDAGLDFQPGFVRFMRGGQMTTALPYRQDGNQVILVGPHMQERLDVLQDGRLRIAREHMVPVTYRKSVR